MLQSLNVRVAAVFAYYASRTHVVESQVMPLNKSVKKDREERRGIFSQSKRSHREGLLTKALSDCDIDEGNLKKTLKPVALGASLSSENLTAHEERHSLYYVVRNADNSHRGCRVRVDLATVYIPSALHSCAHMFSHRTRRLRCVLGCIECEIKIMHNKKPLKM